MKRREIIAGIALLALGTTACASTSGAAQHARPGFVTEVKDGRLWVFREGAKEIEEYRKRGELTKMVTRIGAGQDGMTIRAPDAETIDAYLAAS